VETISRAGSKFPNADIVIGGCAVEQELASASRLRLRHCPARTFCKVEENSKENREK
jgi:hypothetical protein